MALVDRIAALATRVGQELKALKTSKADDAAVLHLSGNETKTGILTFGSPPQVPVGTMASHPVRRDDPRLTDSRGWALYSGTATSGQVPTWDGSSFVPATPASGGGDGIPPLIWTGQISGHYYPRPFALLGGGTNIAQNRLTIAPWLFDAPVDISEIAMYWATSSSGRSVRFGIYSETNGVPTDLLWESSSVPCSGVTSAHAAVSMTLGPGRVWIGVVPQGGGGSSKTDDASPNFMMSPGVSWGVPSGSAFHNHRSSYEHDETVSGALPSTFSPQYSGLIPRMPVVFIRAA